MRRQVYREQFRYELDRDALTEIRGSLNKGLALGAERFEDEVEAAVARSVRAGKSGRRKIQGEQTSPSRWRHRVKSKVLRL